MNAITHDFQNGAPATVAPPNAAATTKRKRLFLMLGASVVVAASAYVGHDIMVGAKHAVTDNAYVGADVALVTPLIGGPVAEVRVQDAQWVRKGELLVRLDDTDARIAVARAEADLAAAVRKVRGMVATDQGLDAQITARAADEARATAQLAAARSELDKARVDLERRQALAATGAVSGDELTTVRNAHNSALANLRAAEAARAQAVATRSAAVGSRNANRALIADATVDQNPAVLAARAALTQARVDLARTLIRAPVGGVVSRRQVQIGQRVQPGATLMTVVPIQAAYVDANFKEVQLAHVRPGQRATLTSDLYGSDVVYHGTVVGFSGGTGAAFAVVPAQNATGNWIKVVQRLPVRIRLDPEELAARPLRVGLSMTADIRTAA